MLCYVVAYLDRINIGIAKLNMLADLQFSEAAYGLGAGLFFIGYMVFEVPSNLIMHRVGARLWIARIMISWGILSGVMAFVTTPWQFYTVRFLLGVAEAGFYPGVILYLTYWFPNRRRAKMTAIFQAGIPVAGLIGNPLSGWIMERFHLVGGHPGWQWLFVLEALPTIPLAIGVLLILSNRVQDATWLTQPQRDLITRDIAEDNAGREHMPLLRALRDARIWKIIAMTFPAMMALYTLGFYLPTLIKDAGAEGGVRIGLLSAIPYLVAMVAMVLVGRSSDLRRERRWHLVFILVLGAVGLVASVFAGTNLTLAVIALSVAAAGIISFAHHVDAAHRLPGRRHGGRVHRHHQQPGQPGRLCQPLPDRLDPRHLSQHRAGHLRDRGRAAGQRPDRAEFRPQESQSLKSPHHGKHTRNTAASGRRRPDPRDQHLRRRIRRPDPLRAFEQYSGQDQILQAFDKSNHQVGGFIEGARQAGAELVCAYVGQATPSGTIEAQAYAQMKRRILDGLRAALPVDGVLLALHGAGVADGVEDIEGDLCVAVRELVGPATPIAAVYDLHGNMTEAMRDSCELTLPCKLYPHTDFHDRGVEAVALLREIIAGRLRPVTVMRRLPMLPYIVTTQEGFIPAEVNAVCAELGQRPGVIDCSWFHGFPYADIAAPCPAVVCTTTGDLALAERCADEVAQWIWSRREDFRPSFPSPAEGVAARPGRRQ